jgi:DNA-binding GntR family transcriptional regulator
MNKARILDYPVQKPLTLRERIVEFIKDAILSGKLAPGEVPEQEIAESFGISRTPIREAFRQLESEGFITVVPRKGAVVSAITAKDVADFYAIKSLLEGYAAKKACLKFKEKEVKRLENLNEHMHKCAERDDVKGFFTLVHQLVQQFERFRVTALTLEGRMDVSVKQHAEIISAFKKGDAELVEKLVMANAEMSEEFLVREISKQKLGEGIDQHL